MENKKKNDFKNIKVDTFSANSLKLLEKDEKEFMEKYLLSLDIKKRDKKALLGQKFHNLICQYLKGFDVEKMALELNLEEKKYWENLREYLKGKEEKFIKTEYPFLIKCAFEENSWNYFLTGRFDAILKDEESYTIYDWKTLNLPKNPTSDLQSVVYLFCANKIFKTEKLKIKYVSIETLETIEVEFSNSKIYKTRIEEIIKKLISKKENSSEKEICFCE